MPKRQELAIRRQNIAGFSLRVTCRAKFGVDGVQRGGVAIQLIIRLPIGNSKRFSGRAVVLNQAISEPGVIFAHAFAIVSFE